MIICLLLVCQSAVTWLCFTPNSEQIITASKDGTMRIWNINGEHILKDDYFFTYISGFIFLANSWCRLQLQILLKIVDKNIWSCLMLLIKNSKQHFDEIL